MKLNLLIFYIYVVFVSPDSNKNNANHVSIHISSYPSTILI